MTLNIKQKPSAIVFDWDNTLVDSWPLILTNFNLAAKELGFPEYNLDEIKMNVGYALRHSFPRIFGEQAEKAQELYRSYYFTSRETNLNLMPGVKKTLEFFHSKYIPMFIVSNKIGDSVRYEAEILDVKPYFKNIVGSLDCEQDKPSITPLKQAVQDSNIELDENVWFVGDTIIDYECAINAGCSSVIIGANDELKLQTEEALHLETLDKLY